MYVNTWGNGMHSLAHTWGACTVVDTGRCIRYTCTKQNFWPSLAPAPMHGSERRFNRINSCVVYGPASSQSIVHNELGVHELMHISVSISIAFHIQHYRRSRLAYFTYYQPLQELCPLSIAETKLVTDVCGNSIAHTWASIGTCTVVDTGRCIRCTKLVA